MMDAPEYKVITSGESLPVSLKPGERLRLHNQIGADLVVIVRTMDGTEVRAAWPGGASLEIKAGTGNALVILAHPEPEAPAARAPVH